MTDSAGVTDAGAPSGSVRVRASMPVEGRRSRWAAVASLLIHVLIVALVVRLGLQQVISADEETFFSPWERPGGGGGGGNEGSGFVAVIPPPPPPPPVEVVVETPVVVPTVIPEPEPEPPAEQPETPPPPAPAGSTGTGGGSGGGDGTGTGPGLGSGVGPGSGGGQGGGVGGGGSRGRAPEPHTMIIPPIDDVPRALRGQSVDVTFHIDLLGSVTALEVDPPIQDRKFSRKFDEAMRSYRFRPARDADNRVVAGAFVVTLTFPGR